MTRWQENLFIFLVTYYNEICPKSFKIGQNRIRSFWPKTNWTFKQWGKHFNFYQSREFSPNLVTLPRYQTFPNFGPECFSPNAKMRKHQKTIFLLRNILNDIFRSRSDSGFPPCPTTTRGHDDPQFQLNSLHFDSILPLETIEITVYYAIEIEVYT